MGLDTTHGAWSGPYSRFNSFRYALGRQVGINLDEYAGYGKGGTKDLASIEHDLRPLFDHSDCDGMLTPQECAQIAGAMGAILDNLKDESEYFLLKEDLVKFRDGCLLAASKNETLEFH